MMKRTFSSFMPDFGGPDSGKSGLGLKHQRSLDSQIKKMRRSENLTKSCSVDHSIHSTEDLPVSINEQREGQLLG